MAYDLSALWIEYRETRGLNERNALAEHYLYLARTVARRFSGRGVEFDDLMQVASLALIGAIERYDGDQGAGFAAFAGPTMAGAVRNYFRDKSRALRMPRRNSELYAKLLDARDRMSVRLGREPSVAEIALELNLTEDDALDIIESRRATSALSLDAPSVNANGGDPVTLGDLLAADETGFERVEEYDQLAITLKKLPPGERKLLELRFAEQYSQRATALRIGASQMQVSRMERRILENLRNEMLDK
ncbi:MAG: sigma-70 family RNA polymerase sigma factor [Oscillospiraceae bacterium]|jgi:RNA polymerase sigma-B factor|nr:sigma-70 family RNA polymerase sigma factor [Oscillospiraceae bacterium]